MVNDSVTTYKVFMGRILDTFVYSTGSPALVVFNDTFLAQRTRKKCKNVKITIILLGFKSKLQAYR